MSPAQQLLKLMGRNKGDIVTVLPNSPRGRLISNLGFRLEGRLDDFNPITRKWRVWFKHTRDNRESHGWLTEEEFN